jgi:hypothetical protein
MKCLACGAEMRLIEVSLADTPMAGFERHIFKCSTCSHISRRLVLSPSLPVANLPPVVQHPEPPATKLQMKRAATGSVRAKSRSSAGDRWPLRTGQRRRSAQRGWKPLRSSAIDRRLLKNRRPLRAPGRSGRRKNVGMHAAPDP